MKLILFLSTLLTTISIMSMEYKSDLEALPNDLALDLIARFEKKNVIRQLSKHFYKFASRRENENILLQPQLYLNQKALDRYLLYYGALGNAAIVRNLLARGANPNVCEDNGMTLMHYAMQCGYDDIAKILFEHPDLVENDTIKPNPFFSLQCNQSSFDRMCPLCVLKAEKLIFNAIEKGLYFAVEYFLSFNVSANVVNKKGESALHCATKAGYPNIMKLLISKGACVNERRHYSYYYSLSYYEALATGHTSALQLLIDHGATNKRFHTQLHYAADKGYAQILKMLLENGADINLKKVWFSNNSRAAIKTPLDVAGNEDIREFLIMHGGKKANEPEEKCLIQ